MKCFLEIQIEIEIKSSMHLRMLNNISIYICRTLINNKLFKIIRERGSLPYGR